MSEVEDPANSLGSTATAHTADERLPTASGDSPKAAQSPPGPSGPASAPSPGLPVQPEEKAPVASKNRYLLSGKAMAATPLPKIGRRLYNYHQTGPPDQKQNHQYATGGVVLEVGGKYYYRLRLGIGVHRAPEEATFSEGDLVYRRLDRLSDGEDDSDSFDSEGEGTAIATPASGSFIFLTRAGEDTDEDAIKGRSSVPDQADQAGSQASLESTVKDKYC